MVLEKWLRSGACFFFVGVGKLKGAARVSVK